MQSINRRKSLLLLASGLVGCTAMNPVASQGQSKMVVDDGVSDIMPVYVMKYTEGQSHTFVRANVYFPIAKQQVELAAEASIRVNGVDPRRDPKTMTSYIGSIPMLSDLLTFEFARSPEHVIKHTFALPEIVEFPSTYSVGKKCMVKVNHQLPRPEVISDTYGLEFEDKDKGPYPMIVDQIEASRVVFRPIAQALGYPQGPVNVYLYRQQRTSLKGVSKDVQSGWAVASKTREFRVTVSDDIMRPVSLRMPLATWAGTRSQRPTDKRVRR